MENIKKFSVDYLIFLLKEVIEFNEINLEIPQSFNEKNFSGINKKLAKMSAVRPRTILQYFIIEMKG